jgi:hypothetical protein
MVIYDTDVPKIVLGISLEMDHFLVKIREEGQIPADSLGEPLRHCGCTLHPRHWTISKE